MSTMNTLLPNLNAAPVAPSVRGGFQADPQPADSSQSSFSNTLREASDRSGDSNQVKPNQAAPAQQPAQNTQETQNQQNAAQNADGAQNAQSTQQASDSSKPVDAKTDDKDAGKDKDKDAAAADSADKASAELLALVAAGQSAAQMTQQAAQQIAAPVAANLVKTDADAKAKTDDSAINADSKGKGQAALAQALPDAWNGQAKGKDAKTGPAGASKPGTPAADNKAAADAASTGKDDAAVQSNGKFADTAALGAAAAAKSPNLQALNGASPGNDNAGFNPALQQVLNSGSAASATSASGSAAADKLSPAVGAPGWDAALGQKMVWMSNNGQQTATLTLNPKDLGPMQVVINVNKNTADASFIASNPEVKHALETAMPKLREMMDQAGIQLGQANVSTGMPNQQQAFSQPQGSSGSGHNGRGHGHGHGGGADQGVDGVIAGGSAPISSGGGLGVVDTFV